MNDSPAFCTVCGAALPPGAFCPSCGSAVHTSAVAERAPVAALEERWDGRSSRGARLAALAAVTAVALGAGGAWLLLRPEPPGAAAVAVHPPSTSSAPSPSTSPSASRAQSAPAASPPAADSLARAARDAAARHTAARRLQVQLQAAGPIERLLDASRAARAEVVSATQGLAECAIPAQAAASGLEHVISLRRRLLDQVDVVDFGPLSHGTQLRAELAQAWESSLDADVSYLAWAQNQDVYGICDTADADYLAGNASSARAVAAKKRFTSLWNRYVASPLHLVARSDGEL